MSMHGSIEGVIETRTVDGQPMEIAATYVPDCLHNLLSLNRFTAKGCLVTFKNSTCEVFKNNKKILTGKRHGKAWIVKLQTQKGLTSPNEHAYNTQEETPKTKALPALTWHARLGHPSPECLATISRHEHELYKGIKINTKDLRTLCVNCCLTKSKKRPVPKTHRQPSTEIMSLAHSDVRTLPCPSRGGNRYTVSLIEDKSRYALEEFIKHKEEVTYAIVRLVRRLNAMTGKSLKILRSDNAGEYKTHRCEEELLKLGCLLKPSPPEKPALNGVAERWNGSITTMVRSLLLEAKLPPNYWAEASNHAIQLKNALPHRALPDGQSPYYVLFGKPPNLQHLRVFGSDCYIAKPASGKKKLDNTADRGVLLGYDAQTKSYRVLMAETQRIRVSADLRIDETTKTRPISKMLEHTSFSAPVLPADSPFLDDADENNARRLPPNSGGASPEIQNEPENSCISEKEPNDNQKTSPTKDGSEMDTDLQPSLIDDPADDDDGSDNQSDGIFDENFSQNSIPDDVPEIPPTDSLEEQPKIRQSRRGRILNKMFFNDEFANLACEEVLPKNYSDAITDPNWKESITEEYKSLEKHGTFKPCKLPLGRRAIGSKLVFKVKQDENGEISRYKTRLVAQGFSQQEGIDYQETFSPVVNMNSVRMVLAISLQLDLELSQMDVCTAYLHGELDEEIYMRPPPGWIEMGKCKSDEVLLLKKGLYGLKQAGRLWHQRLHKLLLSLDLKPMISDPCCYQMSKNGKLIFILMIYVDDITIATKDNSLRAKVKQELERNFEMKDLGELNYFLGMKITRTKNSLALSQEAYVKSKLKALGLENVKSQPSPTSGKTITPAESKPMSQTTYLEHVGSLIYLSTCTRPDIELAVHEVAKKSQNPTEDDFKRVKRIFRYLSGTADRGVTYRKSSTLKLQAFVDANWAEDENDSKSVTGAIIYLQDGPISWKTKKQNVVAKSSTEAEYMALSDCAANVVGARQFLSELNLEPPEPTPIGEDNRGARLIAENKNCSKRTKHIRLRFHHFRDEIEKKQISIVQVPTEQQSADILTKALGPAKFGLAIENLDSPLNLLKM
jgi:hypothetical protein